MKLNKIHYIAIIGQMGTDLVYFFLYLENREKVCVHLKL
ncbi:hypothetical protein Bcell_3901 [Evansella cellulosilytica DSM 2522]|uniref:Uncharacterized protein n=1 Tax=Evansella cellulosilytica (strain ATCC 21833 / DSM 2522 / FERM P-1141 / JCM 9156 / N-4) TaxID=649639 RepID=E6TVL0_EVAC2|nr:hypothetical protein Bcell_3901 [Evansella cellulosilytica DSM 2522]